MLSKDDILRVDDKKLQEVSVPEWGGHVFVRCMSGSERDDFEAAIVQGGKTNLRNIRAKLAVQTICDDTGSLLFSAADEGVVGAKSASALDRIFEVAQTLNRIGNKDVDDLVKNSEGDQSEGSGSA